MSTFPFLSLVSMSEMGETTVKIADFGMGSLVANEEEVYGSGEQAANQKVRLTFSRREV